MTRAPLPALLLLLAGCSGPHDPNPDAPPAPRADPADDAIGAPLHQSLDKARSVEDLSGERKGGLDAAIDETN